MNNFFYDIVNYETSNSKFLQNGNVYALAIIFALLAFLFTKIYLFAIGIILFILLAIKFGKSFLIGSVIVSFIVLTGDLSEGFREIINISGTLILIYSFVEEYGIFTSKLPHPPLLIIYFIILTLASMILSSLFSDNLFVSLSQTIRQFFFFFLCYLIYAWAKDEKRILIITFAIIFAILFLGVTIFSNYLSLGLGAIDPGTYIRRFGGVISNLNASGGLFIIGFPLLIIIPSFLKIDNNFKSQHLY